MSVADQPPFSRPITGPRVLFFGMAGRFSAGPLAALLAVGLPVVAVVVPGLAGPGTPPIERREPPPSSRRLLPLAMPAAAPSILDLAWRDAIPVYSVSRLADPATLATLREHRPEVIGVACFLRRLPAALLALAPLGGLNLHPSLLPAGRGPAPRFWAFRQGLRQSGVTVHRMTARLDAGPVLAQATFDLPDGLTGDAFDTRAATLAGELLVAATRALAAGTARFMPQDERQASYDPAPIDLDYLVMPDRPARWVFNFIKGVAGDGGPLALRLDAMLLPIVDAIEWHSTAELGAPCVPAADGTHWIQCRPGTVRLQLALPAGDRSSAWAGAPASLRGGRLRSHSGGSP